MSARKSVLAAIVLVLVFAAGTSRADRLRDLVREGNRLFTEGKYDEALEKYRSAQVESPESPYIYFNVAAVLQKQGKFEEAIKTYRKVYSREHPWLGAWALYNIGVCQYRQAEQAIAEQDYQKALKLLEACMESNREAMRLDPSDEDPKFNYEQAKRKWKEVLDLLKKQQQKQQQQSQKQGQKQKQQQNQQGQNQKENQSQKKDQKGQGEKKKNEKQNKGRQQPKPSEEKGGEKPSSASLQAQQPPRVGEMTREDAQRLLNSLPEQNAEELRRFLMPRGRAAYRIEKDW